MFPFVLSEEDEKKLQTVFDDFCEILIAQHVSKPIGMVAAAQLTGLTLATYPEPQRTIMRRGIDLIIAVSMESVEEGSSGIDIEAGIAALTKESMAAVRQRRRRRS